MKFKNTFNKNYWRENGRGISTNKKILTIAGSDILSGGGMQADLATFAANGLYGFCALTSIVTVKEDKFLFTL